MPLFPTYLTLLEPAIAAGTTIQYWRGDKTWQTLNAAAVGATTVGANLFGLTNPSAVTFLRVNADNTVDALSAAAFKTALSLNNVENTALSTWAGSSNLTTFGSLTTSTPAGGSSGVWKLGTYTSGLVHIDIGGAGYDLAASGQDLRTSSTPTFSVVNADAFRVGAASTHSFESKTPVPGNVVGLAAWNTSTASNSDVGLFLQTQGSRTAGIILSRSSGLLEVQDSYSGVGTTRFTIDPLSGDTEIKGTVKTGTPAGGTARAWKLGQAASVSPTSPNRTIEVEVNGTTYYLHAKTTND